MKVTLETVARAVDGIVIGDGSIEITGVAGIREAREGELTFLANRRYEAYLSQTRASAIIVAENHLDLGKPLIQNANPYLAFLKAVRLFAGEGDRPAPGVHPRAAVAEDAAIAPDASVGPMAVVDRGACVGPRSVVHAGCYVGSGAKIGADTLLYPNVVVRENCIIGDRVIVHSGTVIGSDGFGFVRDGAIYRKLPQVGNVLIEDDVEIGANVTIDRATTGTTRIGAGTKIDNLVQIAHNVEIGKSCILVAQVGISGSTRVGDQAILAGQAGIVGHIEIGAGAVVAAKSGVSKSVKPGETVFGHPAVPVQQARRMEASVRRLPVLLRNLRELRRRVTALEAAKERE